MEHVRNILSHSASEHLRNFLECGACGAGEGYLITESTWPVEKYFMVQYMKLGACGAGERYFLWGTCEAGKEYPLVWSMWSKLGCVLYIMGCTSNNCGIS
jgi:hypothetical protein